jgi:biofilm PGA synthesis N-glycosyltransferase PgaC
MAELIFWTTLAFLLYTYLGYYVVLWAWGLVRYRPVIRKMNHALPRVSIVIAACNEAPRLARRIDNCLALDYPAEQLEVVVVSDGSTDGTDRLLSGYVLPNLRWTTFRGRLGKAAALNAGVSMATGEIVLFTDVRQQFQSDALRHLVANFTDPEVGAVSGELVIGKPQDCGERHATDLYWRYEKSIRKAESRVDSVVGATGAVYAIRRSLYDPLPVGTILDDVMIPMRIALQGYRVVFEEQALAWDLPARDLHEEYRRKVRTLAGNYQLLGLLPSLLSPTRNRLWFQYLSHKVSRLGAPFALFGLLLSSAVLAPSAPSFAAAFVLQVGAYGLAAMGWLMGDRVRTRLTTVPLTFVMLNLAAVLGLLEFMRLREGSPVHRLWTKSGTQRRAS